MTRDQAQNACDGDLHIKCDAKKIEVEPKPQLAAFGPSKRYDSYIFTSHIRLGTTLFSQFSQFHNRPERYAAFSCKLFNGTEQQNYESTMLQINYVEKENM